MNCGEVKELFSPYLDGQVSGVAMHAVHRHMEGCGNCAREYAAVRQSQQLLSKLGRKRAPADLALRLRVVISREIARTPRSRYEAMMVHVENTLNAFMVPATAGLVSAVLIFGILLGFFALPSQLEAKSDVPLMLYTAPQLEQSVFGTSLSSIGDDSVVIEALVDANGRVQDYRILSQPEDAQAVLPEVKKILIFTTFRPALAMGRPTSGRAVISFSKISVKG